MCSRTAGSRLKTEKLRATMAPAIWPLRGPAGRPTRDPRFHSIASAAGEERSGLPVHQEEVQQHPEDHRAGAVAEREPARGYSANRALRAISLQLSAFSLLQIISRYGYLPSLGDAA